MAPWIRIIPSHVDARPERSRLKLRNRSHFDFYILEITNYGIAEQSHGD